MCPVKRWQFGAVTNLFRPILAAAPYPAGLWDTLEDAEKRMPNWLWPRGPGGSGAPSGGCRWCLTRLSHDGPFLGFLRIGRDDGIGGGDR